MDAVDSQALYRSVVYLLEHGLRTATYKLATMTALVDYCTSKRPADQALPVRVPIPDLGQRVMELYWPQSVPFDGAELRQSTTPRSRILDSINEVRAAANRDDPDISLEVAAQLAPEAYRRALGSISLCLAQQPLPRLQRLPGEPKSTCFLYDDSFLHDAVSLSELQRHHNAIRLQPGVAHGLASLASALHPILQRMWIDDVLRLNRLPHEVRSRLAVHLFGDRLCHSDRRATRPSIPATASKPSAPHAPTTSEHLSTFATRLNRLIALSRSPSGEPYSSGEIAAKIRQSGCPMTVTGVTLLRAGVGQPPSQPVVNALAKLFNVDPTYFSGGRSTEHTPTARSETQHKEEGPTRPPPASPTTGTPPGRWPSEQTGEPAEWDSVMRADLADVVAVCRVESDGCWLAPSDSAVRCRPRGDVRQPADLPMYPLHQWSWMVSKRLTTRSIPPYLIQVHRRCSGRTCCNPSHLYVAAPGGGELTDEAVLALLDKSYVSSSTAENQEWQPSTRFVLTDDVMAVRTYCSTDPSGCWIAPTTGPVACRAKGDERPAKDLPQLAFHRWVWMITHGYAHDPLPGNAFQVRRRCDKKNCCNPEHLFLTTPDGTEVHRDEINRWIRSTGVRAKTESAYAPAGQRLPSQQLSGALGEHGTGGKHRARTEMDDGPHRIADAAASGRSIERFAERLNSLFDTSRKENGETYTAGEVAEALQDDGLAVSEALLSRLRQGTGEFPSSQTVEALAYFFNVDTEYFAAGAHSDTERKTRIPSHGSRHSRHEAQEADVQPRPSLEDDRVGSKLLLTAAEIGRIISGLSETAVDCLSQRPTRLDSAEQLLLFLTELGRRVTNALDRVAVERPLLQELIEGWAAVEQTTRTHNPILQRLIELMDEDLD